MYCGCRVRVEDIKWNGNDFIIFILYGDEFCNVIWVSYVNGVSCNIMNKFVLFDVININ